MSGLVLENLTLRRGPLYTARGIGLQVAPGEVVAILGPNGAGKSTLIGAIFGDIRPEAGRIRLDGVPLAPRSLRAWRKPIGYMPQDIGIEAALSVLDVVLMGKLDALNMHLSEEDIAEALIALAAVGIADLAQREITSLSGGQRQLALFAQVMLRQPRLLLLDEPVSALDMHHQMVLLSHVRAQTRARGLVTLMVLHDLSLAAQFCDRLVLLAGGQVHADGPPAEVLDPALIGGLYGIAVERLTDSRGNPVIRPLPSESASEMTHKLPA